MQYYHVLQRIVGWVKVTVSVTLEMELEMEMKMKMKMERREEREERREKREEKRETLEGYLVGTHRHTPLGISETSSSYFTLHIHPHLRVWVCIAVFLVL